MEDYIIDSVRRNGDETINRFGEDARLLHSGKLSSFQRRKSCWRPRSVQIDIDSILSEDEETEEGFDAPELPQQERDKLRRLSTISEHVAARSRPFTIFEITATGVKKRKLQVHQMLNCIHRHNKDGECDDFSDGVVKLRDLRQLLSGGRQVPFIYTRRNCVILCIPYVRCVFLAGKTFFVPVGYNNFPRESGNLDGLEEKCEVLSLQPAMSFGVDRTFGQVTLKDAYKMAAPSTKLLSSPEEGKGQPTDVDRVLMYKLPKLMQLKSRTPTEILLLESAIVESVEVLQRQQVLLKNAAMSVVHDIREGKAINSKMLGSINGLSRILNGLKEDTQNLSQAISSVSQDTDSMRRLYVSHFWENPSLWEEESKSDKETTVSSTLSGEESRGVDTTKKATLRKRLNDVDMLLECYSQESDMLLKALTWIEECLDDSVAMIELHLGMQRNFLLKMEVWMTATASILGFFSFLTGCMGMNLENGMEKSPYSFHIFWGFTSFMLLVLLVSGIVIGRRIKNLRV